ncbi:MAG: DUF924 family protein [Bauldia sp.]
MDRSVLAAVSRYWFGDLAGFWDFPARHAGKWFQQSCTTDAEIAATFARWLRPAAEAAVDLSALGRTEAIGLVVLLDQFPRNVFRGSAESFAYDVKALAYAKRLLATRKADFYAIERAFLLLPLEHSEALADQEAMMPHFAELAATAPPALAATFRSFEEFAEKHRVLIRRFGRFPHRNTALGRASTPEETEFLAANGRGF